MERPRARNETCTVECTSNNELSQTKGKPARKGRAATARHRVENVESLLVPRGLQVATLMEELEKRNKALKKRKVKAI